MKRRTSRESFPEKSPYLEEELGEKFNPALWDLINAITDLVEEAKALGIDHFQNAGALILKIAEARKAIEADEKLRPVDQEEADVALDTINDIREECKAWSNIYSTVKESLDRLEEILKTKGKQR